MLYMICAFDPEARDHLTCQILYGGRYALPLTAFTDLEYIGEIAALPELIEACDRICTLCDGARTAPDPRYKTYLWQADSAAKAALAHARPLQKGV